MLCHLISMFSKLNFEEDTFYNFPHVCRYNLPLVALTNKLSSKSSTFRLHGSVLAAL